MLLHGSGHGYQGKIGGSKIKTSLVIPFYNNAATVGTTVASCLACKPAPDQIILVDDGSTDESVKAVAEMPVDLIESDHKGRARALNIGLEKAKGEIILFTDADCYVPPDWARKILAALDDESVAGVGGNLLPSRYTAVEVAKVLRYAEEFDSDYLLENKYEGRCLNGNNMAIRTSALREAGGFDEGYVHGADADLTRRLLGKGHKLIRTPGIITHHLKVDTLGSFLRTSYTRGSTIKFSQGQGKDSTLAMFRALALSPFKYFAGDLASISKLSTFDQSGFWWGKGITAAFINLIGEWYNRAGRIHYSRQFNMKDKGG